MHRRIVAGFPELAPFLTSQAVSEAGRRQRRRRTLAAFVAGLALFLGAIASGLSVDAFARNGSQGGFITLLFPHAPPPPDVEGIEILPRHGAIRTVARRAVCVKLCDGAFVPMSPGGGDDAAACASQCPDAPTSVFYRPSGSDRIEDAVSATGQRYSALPVALRYQSVSDNTCMCHRRYSPASASLLTDPTLRKGDAIVTATGVLVFQGAQGALHARSDFTALATARLPAAQKTELLALARSNTLAQPGAPKSWFATRERREEPPAPILLAAQSAKEEIRFVQIIRGGAN